MPSNIKKKKGELVPGTMVECKSGRYVAFYEHRTDIIANGENERDAKMNLKKMYDTIKKIEDKQAERNKSTVSIPKSFKTKSFSEKLEI